MKETLTPIFIFFILFIKGQSDAITSNPNPFSQRTLISYTVMNNDTISINVYNVNGLIIVPLRTDYVVAAGSYQDTLIMDNFPDGIYIVTFKNRQKIFKNLKIIKSFGTAIQEKNDNNLDFRVYPNPVHDRLSIDFNSLADSRNFKVSLTDIVGQAIFVLDDLKLQNKIDLSLFERGIYFLKVQGRPEQKLFKIIKE